MDLTWDDVTWERIRRSGLIEPFSSAREVARALIGVQSQFVPPAGLAIRNRLSADFTASHLDAALQERKTLLRLWGQRNTVHVYDSHDWSTIVAASAAIPSYRERLSDLIGRSEEEFDAAADRVEGILRAAPRASRNDFLAADPSLEPWLRHGNALVMALVRRGVACHAALVGSRSYFAHRDLWMPDLAWDPPTAEAAGVELARRYFATYGPATVRDFAFWLGCKMGDAKRWTAALGDGLVEVSVDDTTLLDSGDRSTDVQAAPPRRGWPLRLLHRFEPLVLAHKDKSWIVDERHYKAVWRKAGYVEAIVLRRGRIGGTWGYQKQAKGARIWIAPFTRIPKAEVAVLRREAEEVARYLELTLLSVEVRSP